MSLPSISVIVAVYNTERNIARCLEAIFALDYLDFNVIVVDNNFSNNTAEIIKGFPVNYLEK